MDHVEDKNLGSLLVLDPFCSKERMCHVFELNQNRLYPRWMKRLLNDSILSHLS